MENSAPVPGPRIAWTTLLVLLAAEALGGLVLVVSAIGGLVAASAEPLGQRLSVFLALVIGWLWVCATLAGALRSRAPWSRGSAITIHVLLFAAGTGILQLSLADPRLGWVLVLMSLAGFFAALLAKPSPR
ncbi:hypothetical protein J4H92_02550 [Leucobacter weissii]|uniref:Uncharacterized protein n=1 Tax=Leucobacter weissii TaxID=1983706 RepID=A0A939MHR2_9MICO|nr:hypothetical protein [Leucobacter weissii]MBO1900826.1 hypothetical protein [Leucobacter weissii]